MIKEWHLLTFCDLTVLLDHFIMAVLTMCQGLNMPNSIIMYLSMS